MNTFTNKSMFLQPAQEILDTSDLFESTNCMIVDGVLYEQLVDDGETPKYRFFFSDDDYDYLENEKMIARLDALFASK